MNGGDTTDIITTEADIWARLNQYINRGATGSFVVPNALAFYVVTLTMPPPFSHGIRRIDDRYTQVTMFKRGAHDE